MATAKKSKPGLQYATVGGQINGAVAGKKVLDKLKGQTYLQKLNTLLEAIPLMVNPSEGGRY